MKTDEQLIAEAVAAGKVQRVPMGTTSDWGDLNYRERCRRMKNVSMRRRITETRARDRIDNVKAT
jgi:hypothetical protein